MMIGQHLGFYGILILWLLWPVFKALDQCSGSGHTDKMATVPFVKISENLHSSARPNPKSISKNYILAACSPLYLHSIPPVCQQLRLLLVLP